MRALWLFGVVMLFGCASSPFPPVASHAEVGQLVLKTPLTIPLHQARVFIQAGQVVDRLEVHEPACEIESWSLSEQLPQLIQVDNFRVAEVFYRHGEFGSGLVLQSGAKTGWGVGLGMGVFSGMQTPLHSRFDHPRLTQATTILRLVSKQQPLIFQMTCVSATGWAPFVEPLTTAEIQSVLGDLASIKLESPL